MTRNLPRRGLPDEVYAMPRSWLWMGHELGAALEPFVQPGEFDAWTFAPPIVGETELRDYRASGPNWARAHSTWSRSLDALLDDLRNARATVVVPDPMAEIGDGFLVAVRSERLIVGRHVAYVVRRPDRDSLEQAWRDAVSASGAMLVLTTSAVPDGSANRAEVATMARHSRLVAFSTYDSDSRLIFFTRTPPGSE